MKKLIFVFIINIAFSICVLNSAPGDAGWVCKSDGTCNGSNVTKRHVGKACYCYGLKNYPCTYDMQCLSYTCKDGKCDESPDTGKIGQFCNNNFTCNDEKAECVKGICAGE